MTDGRTDRDRTVFSKNAVSRHALKTVLKTYQSPYICLLDIPSYQRRFSESLIQVPTSVSFDSYELTVLRGMGDGTA